MRWAREIESDGELMKDNEPTNINMYRGKKLGTSIFFIFPDMIQTNKHTILSPLINPVTGNPDAILYSDKDSKTGLRKKKP